MALLSEYSFNEGSGLVSADSSGGGFDLTASNTTTSWDSGGHTGAGARTEHTGKIGTNAAKTDYTIMCWVKRTGTFTSPASGFAAMVASTGENCFFEAQVSTSYLPEYYGGADSADGVTTPLGLNTWVHVAVTCSGGTTQMYVNGSAEGNTGIGNPAINFGGVNDWVVAGTAGTAGEDADFAGIVDDLRVFDTALSGAQITTWMNTPVGGGAATSVPVMWLKGG